MTASIREGPWLAKASPGAFFISAAAARARMLFAKSLLMKIRAEIV
jgi:hypothetical protein